MEIQEENLDLEIEEIEKIFQKEKEDFIKRLMAKQLSDNTIELYLVHLNLFQKELLLRELSQEVLDDFLMSHNNGVARAFLKNYLEFRKRRDLEIIKITGRKKKIVRKIIPIDKVRLIIEEGYKKKMYLGILFEITYRCALRRNEALNIKALDFEWERWVKDKSRVGVLTIKKGKGNKEREVVVPPDLMKMIQKYCIESNLEQDNYLFPSGRKLRIIGGHKIDGKLIPMSKQKFHEIFNKICKKLFNDHYKIHALRISRATEWFNEGADIVRVQQRLGHENISTTRLYINPDKDAELKKWKEEASTDSLYKT